MKEATDTTFLQKTNTHIMCTEMTSLAQDDPGAYTCEVRPCSLTSRNDVVSLIKNMLMMPRYLMMRVPGRKERGVIFTTVTELPPNPRLERSERERPSGTGLERSNDETAGSKRAGRGPNEGDVKRKRGEGEKKKAKGNGDTLKNS